MSKGTDDVRTLLNNLQTYKIATGQVSADKSTNIYGDVNTITKNHTNKYFTKSRMITNIFYSQNSIIEI